MVLGHHSPFDGWARTVGLATLRRQMVSVAREAYWLGQELHEPIPTGHIICLEDRLPSDAS